MGVFSSLIASFVLLGVLKCETVKNYNIEKNVTTLQQILKISSPSPLAKVQQENRESILLNLNPRSMKDISRALKVVTSDSKQIIQLVSKMFNVNDPNPAYVFSLPQGTKHNNLLVMHRERFQQPIFPNLTASYVYLMRSREKLSEYLNVKNKKHQFNANNLFDDRLNENLVEEDAPSLALNLQTERNFIDFLNKVNKPNGNKKVSDDEWSLLGLDGWQGTLSTDSEEIHLDSKDTPNLAEPLEWDLPGKMNEKLLTNSLLDTVKNNKFMKIVENLTQQSKYPITSLHGLHSDSDVYIARVNDPFGHSTKWNEKNSSSHTIIEERKKRGVIELYSMIKCSTGCDPIIFKGYGCYCGFLGDGIPVDGIDRCCRLHDKCYEYSNCIPYLEYFVPYIWKCYRGKPLCAINHGEWGGPHSCAARLCQCDLSLSRCLRRFLCPHRRAICRTSKTRMLQNILLNL